MNTKAVKGLLLMTGVIFAALQTGQVIWATTIITALCVGIGYYAKNYLKPSNSIEGTVSARDILSAILLALVTAIGDSVSTYVINGAVAWGLLGKEVSYVIVTYLSTTFFSGQKNPA